MGMSNEIKSIIQPILSKHTDVSDFEITKTTIGKSLIIGLPADLISVIRRNHKEFYALNTKLNCENLHFVTIDTGVIKKESNLKVYKKHLKTLGRDIAYPYLLTGFYESVTDQGRNSTLNFNVHRIEENKLKDMSKAFTEITGMRANFILSNEK